jgi:hypothetical protein
MLRKSAFGLAAVTLMALLMTFGPVSAQNGSKKWTIMVYMDADNNLDLAGMNDIFEMQAVGSSSDVDVVVLLDRWNETCGYNGSVLLHVQAGGNMTVWGGWSDDYELNMGDPETLTWFINYTFENFPADRYALILWDHGGNWEGVCWDWTNDDYLTMEEIKGALANSIVDKIDLLGFDACLMGSVEVAYTMKLSGKAGVMVASEDSIPWNGWPYDMVLTDLVQTPSWDEHEFSIDIVDQYVASYSKIGWCKIFSTLSAVDLSQIENAINRLANLTEELVINFDNYKGAITGAKNKADRYWFGMWHQGPYIDLYHFVESLGKIEDNLKLYTNPILETWNDLVICSKCSAGPHNNGAEGFTVYFPRNKNSFYALEPYYENIPEFADETNWNNLLGTYFNE